MADPITWDQGARAAGVSETIPITPFQYSTAATLDTQLEDLVKTNPGAVAWLLQTAGPAQADNESIKHPGQIITLARRTLEDKGLDHSHWRTATVLDTDSMSFLALTDPPSRVIKVISTLAMAGGTTGKRTTRLITKLIPTPQHHSSTIVPGVTLENWDIAKLLLAKAANATVSLYEVRDLTEQSQEVSDYIRNIPQEHQQPITATTWKGLVKAAQRWHREQRAISKEKKWQKALSDKGGRYLAWDSALDPTEINGFQVTPLTDEKQLHEETDWMGHCVYTYAETCANGTSRIFSLTLNGRPAGTSQITLKTKEWTEVQTRGVNNHTPPPGSLETMQEISARYTLAHQEKGHAPPRLVDPETGQETPFVHKR